MAELEKRGRWSTMYVANHVLAYFFVSHPFAGMQLGERCDQGFLLVTR